MFNPVQLALMANQQDLRSALNQWKSYADELEGEVKRLQRLVNQKEAAIAGLSAQVNAMRQAHPNSPLVTETNIIMKTGKYAGQRKTKLRLIYENAFDETARKLGITNPLSIRTN